MELEKQFTFSGTFKKFHEEDIQPIEISNSNIYCYTNGNVLLEINSKVNQYINYKKLDESAPTYQAYQIEGTEKEELVQQAYEGDYEIVGKTIEGWKISAIIADSNIKITFNFDKSKNIGYDDKYQIKLRDLRVEYNLQLTEEGQKKQTQEAVYGLANIEVTYDFLAKVGSLDAEIHVKSVSARKGEKQGGVLSTEMKLKNICKDNKLLARLTVLGLSRFSRLHQDVALIKSTGLKLRGIETR